MPKLELLDIIVRGRHDMGKTTVANLIKMFLEENGYADVVVRDVPPLPPEEKDRFMNRFMRNRGLWRLAELEISCAVAPGTGDRIRFRMRRTMPAAGLVCGLRVPTHLGRWYQVTSVRVGDRELLREPASAAVLGLPGDTPPWMAPARRGDVVSVEVLRVGGSFSFAGAVLCALRVSRRRGRPL